MRDTPSARCDRRIRYAIGLRFEIGDDFGVDTADLYADSLRAFWLLQHERSAPRPFVNMLDLTTSVSGSF